METMKENNAFMNKNQNFKLTTVSKKFEQKPRVLLELILQIVSKTSKNKNLI